MYFLIFSIFSFNFFSIFVFINLYIFLSLLDLLNLDTFFLFSFFGLRYFLRELWNNFFILVYDIVIKVPNSTSQTNGGDLSLYFENKNLATMWC